MRDPLAAQFVASQSYIQWIEPIWKMLLSNERILPILWELFAHHANLLACYFGGPKRMTDYVKKPLLSREGANLSIHRGDTVAATGGPYGEEGFVYQAIAPAAHYEGASPILGR